MVKSMPECVNPESNKTEWELLVAKKEESYIL